MNVKLYMDTEFTGLQMPTSLISIGIVSDFGTSFYAELTDYNEDQVDEWIKENVIDNLIHTGPKWDVLNIDYPKRGSSCFKINTTAKQFGNTRFYSTHILTEEYNKGSYSVSLKGNSEKLREELTKWLDTFFVFGEVEMVSDCLSYDWVLFNNIFGHAFNIHRVVNYIPTDICTMFRDSGIDPDTNREEFIKMYDRALPEGSKHNSLYDAKVIRECYHGIKNLGIVK